MLFRSVRRAEELVERYHAQLDYYAKALEQMTQKKVREKIIYSFTLREEIQIGNDKEEIQIGDDKEEIRRR